MTLFEQWNEKLEGDQNTPGYAQFFENYITRETEVYKGLLAEKKTVVDGTVGELAKSWNMDPVTCVGYFDGINSSLETELDLASLTEESTVHLDINLEKLYYNMLDAKANWLFELPEWEGLLPGETRVSITKKFREDNRAVSTKVGRNDPCPCGSGKKFKKCCGA